MAEEAPDPANGDPVTDHDWTVRSLNVHGLFFERWCEQRISGTTGWSVTSIQYPVEYPPGRGSERGQESALDIRAETLQPDQWTLAVECKKHNPDFTDWLCFPRAEGAPGQTFGVRHVENIAVGEPNRAWTAVSFVQGGHVSAPTAPEAREVRGTYQGYKKADKTKTTTDSIERAAYQVAVAVQAIADEAVRHNRARGRVTTDRWPDYRQRFLAVIVTTARLFRCQFDPDRVDGATGEIGYDKVALTPVPYFVYNYALRRHLQVRPESLRDTLQRDGFGLFVRLPIFVVQSASLVAFLSALRMRTLITFYPQERFNTLLPEDADRER
jgi:hypothetical protein